jgi:hypothetical protein
MDKKEDNTTARVEEIYSPAPTIPEQISGKWFPDRVSPKYRWFFWVLLVLAAGGVIAYIVYDVALFLNQEQILFGWVGVYN